MEAHVGDHVVVEGAKVGQARRRGEVIELLPGAGGRPGCGCGGKAATTSRSSPPGRTCRVETGEGGGRDRPDVAAASTCRLSEDADHCEAVAHVRRAGPRLLGLGAGPPQPGRPADARRSARSWPSPGPCRRCPTSSSWPRPTRWSPPSAVPWPCTSRGSRTTDRGRPAALQALTGSRTPTRCRQAMAGRPCPPGRPTPSPRGPCRSTRSARARRTGRRERCGRSRWPGRARWPRAGGCRSRAGPSGSRGAAASSSSRASTARLTPRRRAAGAVYMRLHLGVVGGAAEHGADGAAAHRLAVEPGHDEQRRPAATPARAGRPTRRPHRRRHRRHRRRRRSARRFRPPARRTGPGTRARRRARR